MNQNYITIKNYFITAAVMLLFIAKQTSAQAPQIQWAKCFGGSANDVATDLHRTADSGYVVCGYTASTDGQVALNHGGLDAWIVKLDVAGTLLWEKTYGGTSDEVFNAIRELKDGGYLACGYTSSSDGDVDTVKGGQDFWVVRIDASGAIVWERTFGGLSDDVANDVATTADTGYVVAGYTFSSDSLGDVTNYKDNGDGWIAYVDTLGNLIQEKAKGGQEFDEFKSIITTSNGGFLLVGTSSSNTGTLDSLNHGGSDAWLARLSKSGSDQWNNLYGDTLDDGGYDVHEDEFHHLVVSGFRHDGGIGTNDSWLFTVDSLGTFLSESIHGGTGNEMPGSSIEKELTNYIVAGSSNSDSTGDKDCHIGGYDFWMYNTLSGGAITWQKCMGGSGDDISTRAIASPDGSVTICGYTNSIDLEVVGNHGGNDFWVVRLEDGCDLSAAFADSITGNSVSFTNNSFDANSFLWTFGDGSTSTEINPTHVYDTAGVTYNVCLIATSLCATDTICSDVTIVCPALNAGFSISIDSLTLSFTDLSDGALTWSWTFGDGGTSTDQNPVHLFTYGTFDVCLFVTNSCSTDTFCQSIVITCPPVGSGFSYSVTGLSVSFTDISSGASSWNWTFGDGNSSTLQNPSNNYATPGTYPACLIASNGCGSDTFCLDITVQCPPFNAGFSLQQNENVLTFTDLSLTATSWQWTFGDGGTSTDQNPVHTYTANGIYEVCLIASDDCSSDTTCDSVEVIGLGVNAATIQTSSVSIYPNPSNDVATISFNIGAASFVTITLNNVQGRLVKTVLSENLAAGDHSIAISIRDLPAGIYLLQLKEGSLSVVRRLAVE